MSEQKLKSPNHRPVNNQVTDVNKVLKKLQTNFGRISIAKNQQAINLNSQVCLELSSIEADRKMSRPESL